MAERGDGDECKSSISDQRFALEKIHIGPWVANENMSNHLYVMYLVC